MVDAWVSHQLSPALLVFAMRLFNTCLAFFSNSFFSSFSFFSCSFRCFSSSVSVLAFLFLFFSSGSGECSGDSDLDFLPLFFAFFFFLAGSLYIHVPPPTKVSYMIGANQNYMHGSHCFAKPVVECCLLCSKEEYHTQLMLYTAPC